MSLLSSFFPASVITDKVFVSRRAAAEEISGVFRRSPASETRGGLK